MELVSTAAQVIITVIPIVGIVMGSIVIFFFLLWNHRQKVLLIEKGGYEPKAFDLVTFSLLAGLLLVGIGVALTVLFAIVEGLDYVLLGGVIPLSLGASLTAFYFIRKNTDRG